MPVSRRRPSSSRTATDRDIPTSADLEQPTVTEVRDDVEDEEPVPPIRAEPVQDEPVRDLLVDGTPVVLALKRGTQDAGEVVVHKVGTGTVSIHLEASPKLYVLSKETRSAIVRALSLRVQPLVKFPTSE